MENEICKTQADKKTEWTFSGVWIPAEVVLSDELIPMDKLIFGIIQNLAYGEEGCWASNNFIAVRARTGKQNVSNSVSKLVKLKFINATHIRSSYNETKRYLKVNPELMTKLHKEKQAKLLKTSVEINYPSINTVIGGYNRTNTKNIIEDINEINKKETKTNTPTIKTGGSTCDKTPISSKINRPIRNLSYMLYQNVIKCPSTEAERIASIFFDVFQQYRTEIHPMISDMQMMKGLELIKEHMEYFDEDEIYDVMKQHFHKAIFHEQGRDFRFNLFVANLHMYVSERYRYLK